MRRFGLIGKNISYSFSRAYFGRKFEEMQIPASYENFDLQDISDFPEILKKNQNLKGLNVTIPYKEQIISYLDELDPEAEDIGAVNTIRFTPGKLKGYNTDHFGFSEAIRPLLRKHHKKALILGTGGASKAVAYALKMLKIDPVFVSRTSRENAFSYQELDRQIMQDYSVIINCTPLGTSPRTEEFPEIPVEFITADHLVFDLIYNPGETRLMKLAAGKGAQVCNGLKMLELQAEKAWEIWNRS